jgi:hypothetical protein
VLFDIVGNKRTVKMYQRSNRSDWRVIRGDSNIYRMEIDGLCLEKSQGICGTQPDDLGRKNAKLTGHDPRE